MIKFSSIPAVVRTLWALGPTNVLRVANYRAWLRLRWHPVQRLRGVEVPAGPFFSRLLGKVDGLTVPEEWPGPHGYFGWCKVPTGRKPPDWMLNPLTGGRVSNADKPWWEIPDFDPSVGDIKGVWEASRLDWTVRFALRAKAGDDSAIETLNCWLTDWRARNPAYFGPNWKCGQEASIRLMHLALSARLLDSVRRPQAPLIALVRAHLWRIDPTLGYAIGQSNNHGTSEAAALFIGGVWLAALGDPTGKYYAARGRAGLEERGLHLILEDGTFSQYSVNYHRLVLDTYSLVELWRRDFALEPFTARLVSRISAAVDWLAAMVDPQCGDAPNLGANDGANLLPLTEASYRDFRPAVQLSGALFRGRRYYSGVPSCDAQLATLSVSVPELPASDAGSLGLLSGGFIVLRQENRLALLRVPRYQFRPGHADPLHVDLWVGSENHLRDDGSFGYNVDAESMRYFGAVRGHNTVQFDESEPMPRLGRFLWGDWIQASSVSGPSTDGEALTTKAAYSTVSGAYHERALTLLPSKLQVVDRVAYFRRCAVWRWRLLPGDWSLLADGVRGSAGRLRVAAQMPIVRIALTEGWESRHYATRSRVPVLEVEVATQGILCTSYEWSR